MPRPSSTPSIIIPLVYVILELRPTKNKQRFRLKASEFLVGVRLERKTARFHQRCLLWKTDLSPTKDLLRVYDFTPFCLYQLLNQPSNTLPACGTDAKCFNKASKALRRKYLKLIEPNWEVPWWKWLLSYKYCWLHIIRAYRLFILADDWELLYPTLCSV